MKSINEKVLLGKKQAKELLGTINSENDYTTDLNILAKTIEKNGDLKEINIYNFDDYDFLNFIKEMKIPEENIIEDSILLSEDTISIVLKKGNPAKMREALAFNLGIVHLFQSVEEYKNAAENNYAFFQLKAFASEVLMPENKIFKALFLDNKSIEEISILFGVSIEMIQSKISAILGV